MRARDFVCPRRVGAYAPLAAPAMGAQSKARSDLMRFALAGAVGVFLALTTAAALAGETHSAAEIEAARREMVARLFKPDYGDIAQRERAGCFLGKQPQRVATDWADGAYFTPNASDICVAALTRLGRDGQLVAYYRTYLTQVQGDPAQADSFAAAMSSAVTKGNGKATIGAGWAIAVRPAMAFDAGFTLAYQQRSPVPSGSFEEARVKAIIETCLADQADAKTCWSVGYLYGARAYHGQVLAGQ